MSDQTLSTKFKPLTQTDLSKLVAPKWVILRPVRQPRPEEEAK